MGFYCLPIFPSFFRVFNREIHDLIAREVFIVGHSEGRSLVALVDPSLIKMESIKRGGGPKRENVDPRWINSLLNEGQQLSFFFR